MRRILVICILILSVTLISCNANGSIKENTVALPTSTVLSPIITPTPIIFKHLNIKILGDSVTAGLGCTGYAMTGEKIFSDFRVNEKGYCYANMLKDYFESEYNCTVKNWGTRGINSNHILENISTLISHDDDIIFVMIGINDSCNNTIEKFKENMECIIQYVQALDKKIILITCSPINNPKVHYLDDVENVELELAETYNIKCINLYREFLTYCTVENVKIETLMNDEIHPNDDGQTLMFNIIKNDDAVKELALQ